MGFGRSWLRRGPGRFAPTLVLLVSAFLPALARAAGPPITQNDRFGIDFVSAAGVTFANQSQRNAEAVQAGAGWDRFPIYWSNLESACNGSYDWSQVDPAVNNDTAQNLKIDAILLATPPCYATLASSTAGLPPPVPARGGLRALSGSVNSAPTGLYLPTFADQTDTWWPGKPINPANPWARFVNAAVTRYHGQIQYWEIWNEPDSSSFWVSTIADYVRLLKVAYLAAHAADPSAHLLVGGMMYWQYANQSGEQAWLKQFLPLLTADPSAPANGYYFDVIPWHWYSRSSDIYTHLQSAQSVLASYGLQSKELWVNETNAPACNETVNGNYVNCADVTTWARGYATLDEQASFILQAFAYAFAVGATKVFQFQLQDDGNAQAFGMFRNDGSARPEYAAYQFGVQYLEGFTTVRRSVANGAEGVTFGVPGANPHRTTILWNDTGVPTSVTVLGADVPATSVSLIKQDGTQQSLAPASSYAVTLLPATDNRNYDSPWNPNDYIIGGPTLLLVENLPADTTPPASAVAALPATTTLVGFTVTWSGSDPNGWGIFDYTIQYRDQTSGGAWVNWLTNTTSTSAWFTPPTNHTYQFRSLARDWAGNVEVKGASVADATTTANGAIYTRYLPHLGAGGPAGW